ncbi:archaeosortase/exosortase family protein [Microbacterium hydrocarbonoxydans]|uniref:archaeosortase/exosortase family protein n=1 Tax=Microbacterium hydrocarbonoxydans TaxID=273678 RepID=UPI00203B6535|nr:archaeosortase/exosortase family protein [Microbacterium hydrocarbonoxydans]MCM3781273.1 archaeosortase/exosortase family protein [Microbacterium hydrocarbonoxydans]
MTTSALPLSRRTLRQRPLLPRLDRALRILIAMALSAGSIALVTINNAVRGIEAMIASWFLSPFTRDQIDASLDRYFVWTGDDKLIALQVTVECTALLIGVPLTLIAAVILATTRARWGRILLATITMWAIVVLVNASRLTLIGWATQTWGLDPGYTVSHTFVGSVVGILGYALGLAALFLIIGVKKPRGLRRPAPRDAASAEGPQYRRGQNAASPTAALPTRRDRSNRR